MTNEELKGLYDQVYANGKENFFTFSTEDISREVLLELDWQNRDVLEIGCGTGETSALLAAAGARVLATDYAAPAIQEAQHRHQHDNLNFEAKSFHEIEGDFDVVISQEVIEHTDDPVEFLRSLKEHLRADGVMIITCPSFLNLRGHVWMTLQLLLNVPMSLSDKHFISPFDMERWASQLGLTCEWRTFRYWQAHGEEIIVDFRKRLTNALRDAGLDNSKVERLLAWLDQARRYEQDSQTNGAKALYRLRFRTFSR